MQSQTGLPGIPTTEEEEKDNFHHMSPKHLQKYVNEFASRQSMRRCDTIDAMAITTKAGVGKSLSWKELTNVTT